jgi:hypothetical protein
VEFIQLTNRLGLRRIVEERAGSQFFLIPL